jgi:type I restriction enzyme R subunit
MVQAQMPLILEIQTDIWWQDVTAAILETVRRRLRSLVQLIDKQQRKIVYTDFVDLMGPETVFTLPGTSVGTDYDKFRAKARTFLRQHLDHVTIAKLRMNCALTPSDLVELERLLATSGVAGPDDIRRAANEAKGLGVFVRSLVGLDRAAAKDAMARFVNERTLSANQLEFINLIVDHLTEHGVMAPERLYESPFTDLTPRGPDGLFRPADIDALIAVLESVRSTAVAA